VIGSLLAREPIPPELLRRNVAVAGINLLALKDKYFEIGSTLLQGTGLCAPCSRMEELLGPGGYNAMRGHGGITARVIRGGWIAIDDCVRRVPAPA
ncbi:MAG TPA: MOSC domain-containing protein, partial [Planctomycetaceae bacterium]|nr:MOSC domain-containing protein [Planctomycetaceae bacterium]